MLHLFLWALIFGFCGQLLRSLIGLQKMARSGAALDEVSLPRLAISLVLGALAGMVGALTYTPDPEMAARAALSLDEVNRNFILITLGAGYAGADFVEGALGRTGPRR